MKAARKKEPDKNPDQKGKPGSLSGTNEYIDHGLVTVSLLENVTDPVLLAGLDGGGIFFANGAAAAAFGYSVDELCNKTLPLLFSDPQRLLRLQQRRLSVLSEARCTRKGGGSFAAGIRFIYFNKRHKGCVMLILYNIADPVGRDQQRAAWQKLFLEMTTTRSAFFYGEEHERQRLSRELHGSLGPVALSVKLGMEHLLLAKKKAIPRKELKKLLQVQTDLIRQLRVETSRLARGFEYQENINSAIERLLREYANLSGIKVYCKADELPQDLSRPVSYHFFQIVEEALTNMVMHAGAGRASFRIRVAGRQATMILYDNGRGCDKLAVDEGKGLWMMQQRALLISGSIVFESCRHGCFRVILSFPLSG